MRLIDADALEINIETFATVYGLNNTLHKTE